MTTRFRGAPATIRRGSAALLLACALPLSACGFPFTPYAGGAQRVDGTADGVTTPVPTNSDGTAGPSTAGSLFFDDESLPAGHHPEWSDGLLADAGWKVSKPDDGNGHWSYATTDDVCTVEFYQGTASSTGAKDDREASDLALAALTQATIADVTAAASDLPFKNSLSGDHDIDSRMVQGHNDAATWVMQARVFEQAGFVVYFILDCTDDRAATVADEIIEKDPVLIR